MRWMQRIHRPTARTKCIIGYSLVCQAGAMPGRKCIYAAERLREVVSLLAAHTLKPDLGSDWVEGRHRVERGPMFSQILTAASPPSGHLFDRDAGFASILVVKT